jgi:hypothetical protein
MVFVPRVFVFRIDVDMRNVVSRMAVPYGEAKSRLGRRIKEKQVRGMQTPESSRPSVAFSAQPAHLQLVIGIVPIIAGVKPAPSNRRSSREPEEASHYASDRCRVLLVIRSSDPSNPFRESVTSTLVTSRLWVSIFRSSAARRGATANKQNFFRLSQSLGGHA